MMALVRAHVLPAAYALLPRAMSSDDATGTLLSIGYHESKFLHRTQVVVVGGQRRDGKARGFWQFEEQGAVRGVLSHQATSVLARDALVSLRYRRDLTVREVWERLEHNDILAAVFARLLLWTLPQRLPSRHERERGWLQYMDAWRPGIPREKEWGESWHQGWSALV